MATRAHLFLHPGGRQGKNTIPGSVLPARKPVIQQRCGSSSPCPEPLLLRSARGGWQRKSSIQIQGRQEEKGGRRREKGRGGGRREEEEEGRRGRGEEEREEGENGGSAVSSITWETHFEALPILNAYTDCLFLFFSTNRNTCTHKKQRKTPSNRHTSLYFPPSGLSSYLCFLL